MFQNLQTGMRISSGCEYDGLYYLDDSTLHSCLDAISPSNIPVQWHYRLRHPFFAEVASSTTYRRLYYYFRLWILSIRKAISCLLPTLAMLITGVLFLNYPLWCLGLCYITSMSGFLYFLVLWMIILECLGCICWKTGHKT